MKYRNAPRKIISTETPFRLVYGAIHLWRPQERQAFDPPVHIAPPCERSHAVRNRRHKIHMNFKNFLTEKSLEFSYNYVHNVLCTKLCRMALLMIMRCQHVRNCKRFFTTEKVEKLIMHQVEKPWPMWQLIWRECEIVWLNELEWRLTGILVWHFKLTASAFCVIRENASSNR